MKSVRSVSVTNQARSEPTKQPWQFYSAVTTILRSRWQNFGYFTTVHLHLLLSFLYFLQFWYNDRKPSNELWTVYFALPSKTTFQDDEKYNFCTVLRNFAPSFRSDVGFGLWCHMAKWDYRVTRVIMPILALTHDWLEPEKAWFHKSYQWLVTQW